MQFHYISLQNITAPQALILKQEMLARGGEVAIPRNVISTEWEKLKQQFDVILIGTMLQLKNLIKKLKGQDLNLQQIGQIVEKLISIPKHKDFYSKT